MPDDLGPHNNADVDHKVPCAVCKEPINDGARVCIHCNRPQDPKVRFLVQLGKVVAAIVAVGSLASGAISLWNFIPSKAELSIVPKNCTREAINIAVANLGDKPAILRSGGLVLESEPAVQKEEKEWPLTPSLTVIQPHETEEVSLEWIVNNQKQKLPKRRVQMKSCSYNVEVRYADFEGRSMSLKFECQCPE